jgi:hypothetical protein
MQRKQCDFANANEFKQCIYDYFCQCYTQCIDLDSDFPNKQAVCTEIVVDGDIAEPSYYDDLIQKCLDFFIERKLLYKSGVIYYIILKDKSKIRLTWENIKTLDDIESVKMFWLLRKIIVDSILKKILKKMFKKNKNTDIRVFSVGSIKLTSDYDITLYGGNNEKIKILQLFNKYFKVYFFDESSVTFDTNIYGKAYITFSKNEYSKHIVKAKCGGQIFYYLKQHPSQETQLMWGIIKYLRDFKDSFGDSMFNDLMKFMENKLQNFTILQVANNTRRSLSNKDPLKTNYISLMRTEQEFVNNYRYDNELLGLHDFISIVNFYGVETYFTRGAFLDTVVNSQMCGNQTIVELTEVDMITSILENTGFFFIHSNKTKYLVRVVQTLNKLINEHPTYTQNVQSTLIKLQETLQNLQETHNNDYDSKYCKEWANPENDLIDILKCQKYNVFNLLINLIWLILKSYHTSHPESTASQILFFDKFVDKSFSDSYKNISIENLNREINSSSNSSSSSFDIKLPNVHKTKFNFTSSATNLH